MSYAQLMGLEDETISDIDIMREIIRAQQQHKPGIIIGVIKKVNIRLSEVDPSGIEEELFRKRAE